MSWTVTPSPNFGSQLERAIIAYLYEAWNTALLARPAFYFSSDWKERADANLIDVLAFKSQEVPEYSANEEYSVRVNAMWPGTNAIGASNPDTNWVTINKLIGMAAAAMHVTDNAGQDYRVVARRITAAGRRLAVVGGRHIFGDNCDLATDLANHADMATFICDAIRPTGAERAQTSEQGLVLVEQRSYSAMGWNGSDNSVFPALTFDGVDELSWVFTDAAPAWWILEKSADGITWEQHGADIAGGMTTASIAGTGTNYWRVWRSNDGATLIDPESNTVLAEAA